MKIVDAVKTELKMPNLQGQAESGHVGDADSR